MERDSDDDTESAEASETGGLQSREKEAAEGSGQRAEEEAASEAQAGSDQCRTKERKTVAGNIHKEEYRQFWKESLQADDYILEILKTGYKLPFRKGCKPQRYREENNKSALKYVDYAYEETEKWMVKRVVKEVMEPPLCISPLTVAVRTIGDLEKLRLCLDLSRYINTLLQKEAVKLAGIDKCTQNLFPGDYIAIYDLTSAFHHIKIFEEHQQYLGFALPGRDGKKERYFVFLVMPFGLASAVKCITRITKPLCSYFAKNGIRHSIYIDDGNVLARALALVIAHLDFVLNALKQAGFVILEEKTDTIETVSQVKLYLGFVVDSTTMTLKISAEKLQDLRQALCTVIQSPGPLKAKTVAKAIGKLVAAEPALGPVVQLLSRTAQGELASHTEAKGWNTWMSVSDQAKTA